MINFLHRILPPLPEREFGGAYPCYYLFGLDAQKVPHQVPFLNISDVPQLCAERLAGMNTYVSPAVYQDSSFGRKADNTVCMRALWMDLDVGKPHNSYATLDEALSSLTSFVNTTGLKPTVVVHSGVGLQAYWTFTKALPTATWKQLAGLFTAVCVSQGLIIDPSCPQDAARVLRLPGTLHLSSGNTAKVLIDKGKDWEPRVLWDTMKPFIPQDATVSTTPAAPPIANQGAMQRAASLTRVQTPLTARAAPIITQCQCCLTAGLGAEPQWFAMLGVMRSCVDGREWAHKVSATDKARYVPEDTDAKFDRLQENMPPRCETFAQLMPHLCAACPHKGKLTSPIQLGIPTTPQATVVEEAPLTPPVIDHLVIPERFSYSLQSLQDRHFFVDERGCVYRKWKQAEDGSWEYVDQVITTAKIYYSHSVYDTVDNAPHRTHWFAVETVKGRELVPFIIERDMTIQKIARWFMEANAFFAGVGVKPQLLMEFMNTYLQSVLGSSVEIRTLRKFGWVKYPDPKLGLEVEGFALGPGVVTETGIHHTQYEGVAERLATDELHYKGNLEEWKRIPQMYRVLDQKVAQLAICMSFAAPLMKFAPGIATSGVFSLWSNHSGLGKSQVMRACASIWGDPDAQFIQRHSSAVLRQRKLSTIVNLPCFMDELTDVKDEDLYSLAYTLVDGREKQKLKSSGADMVETGNWKTITFTTANKSFKEAAARVAGDSDASILRVMEMECNFQSFQNEPTVLQYIDKCIELCQQHYGLAGPEFMYQLMRHKDRLETLTVRVSNWMRKNRFANYERYMSAALGLTLIVARWVAEWGLIDFDLDALEHWVLTEFVPHNRIMTKANAVEHTQMLRNYITDRQLNVLVVASHTRPADMKPVTQDKGAPDPYIISFPSREVRLRLEDAEQDLYIDMGDLAQWCKAHGMSVKVMLRELEQQGVVWEYVLQSATDGIDWAFSPVTQMVKLQVPNVQAYIKNPKVEGQD